MDRTGHATLATSVSEKGSCIYLKFLIAIIASQKFCTPAVHICIHQMFLRAVVLAALISHLATPFRLTGNTRRPLFVRAQEDRAQEDEKKVASTNDEGQFKISKPKITGLGDEFTEPAFRQVRQPSPLSDNVIIVASTLAGLGALVALFLYLNKDAPPPPYLIREKQQQHQKHL